MFLFFFLFFCWSQAYEKHTTPNWPYDLGRKTNFEQVLSPSQNAIFRLILGLTEEVFGYLKRWNLGDKQQPKLWKFLFLDFVLNQVFGRDKLYWFLPLYTEDDLKRLPALRGLDFTSRSEESEPLQSLWPFKASIFFFVEIGSALCMYQIKYYLFSILSCCF